MSEGVHAVYARVARPDDASHFGRIRVAAWQTAYRGIMPDAYLDTLDPAANLDGLRALLAAPSPAFRAWVGELDGMPQGFAITGTPRFEADAGVAELYALNAAPEAWGTGLAQPLIDVAVAAAHADGARRVALWCIEANHRARRCYERAGFVAGGVQRTTDGLTGHPITEVDYWLDLA